MTDSQPANHPGSFAVAKMRYAIASRLKRTGTTFPLYKRTGTAFPCVPVRLEPCTRYTIYSIMSITLQRYLWLRNTKYTHNNNHQQVHNNSYLTDRDKTGHNYRENSEISDRLFNSVNPSLHERCATLKYSRPYRCNARKLVKTDLPALIHKRWLLKNSSQLEFKQKTVAYR